VIKLGLERIQNLCDAIQNPQDSLKFIHIAGTNGKGSVLSYISSILRKAGLKVGTYSSPAVFCREEIIAVNGRNISKKAYDEGMDYLLEKCKELVDEGGELPSEFELQTALAFKYFYDQKCDIVVLECGMGGLTDATNIVKNTLAAVFTSISFDHMEYLGDSLHKIAKVKAGIIKEWTLVYTSNTDEDVISAINEVAENYGEAVNIIKPDMSLKKYVPLKGEHQLMNASLAAAVVKGLSAFGIEVSSKSIEAGLKSTSWPGRFELISKKPDIIIDGAHNPDAAGRLRDTLLKEYPGRRYIFVCGMYVDKEHDKVLSIMAPLAHQMLTITTFGPRTYNAVELAKDALKYQENVSAIGGIDEAMDIAYLMAEPKDVIVVFGTLSILNDVKKWYKVKNS